MTAKPPPPPPGWLEQAMPVWAATQAHLRAVVAELRSQNGILRTGARPMPILNNQSMRVATGQGQYAGHSFHETSGSAGALIRLYDGAESGGDLIGIIALVAGESARDWYLPHGLGYVNGLYVQVASGQVEGVVYLVPFGG